MCRDVNLLALKGVIFDHACGLDQYLLNREPREFEYLRCLVDGAHWQVRAIICHNITNVTNSGTKEIETARQFW